MPIAIIDTITTIALDFDFVEIMVFTGNYEFELFSRRKDRLGNWLTLRLALRNVYKNEYSNFKNTCYFDFIINLIGIGSFIKLLGMGASILDIIFQFDSLVLDCLRCNN